MTLGWVSWWPSLLLIAARLWACLRCQESWRRALGPRWEWVSALAALALALLLLVSGAAWLRPPLFEGWAELALALAFELLLGAACGALVSLPGHALVGAADTCEGLLLEQRGELGAQASRSLGLLLVVSSLAAALTLGLHRPLLRALLEGFASFPLGMPTQWFEAAAPLAQRLPRAAAAASVLALALATPVLLAQVLATLLLTCLARSGPNIEALTSALGPGLRLGLALVALGAAWSAYPEAFARGM